MAVKKIALILGNCLFPNHSALKPDQETVFVMMEDYGLCTHFKYHKHKIVMFLAAMRAHANMIRSQNSLIYKHLKEGNQSTYEEKLSSVLKENPSITSLVTYEIEDHFFETRIRKFCQQHQIQLEIVNSPGFLNTKEDFKEYLKSVKKPFQHTFYQQQRKKRDILIDSDGKPMNGKWSFDEDNRKKLPKNIYVPPVKEFVQSEIVKDVCQLTEKLFPKHPGNTENFGWATTREEALECLEDFLEKKFSEFGPYEDAIDQNRVFLFHSVLSPYINLGLLTPKEVIDKALLYANENETNFSSLEGFVRQIMGWREFMRGIYHEYDEKLQGNYFGHQRIMTDDWYNGTTGVPPLDDSIKKASTYGYTHHIERLMVLGNIMLLCEIHPDEVYKWFMEMYVDSSDWVMAPNVYGMSQFSDGGIFATKPYIGGSAYILKMSNYSKKGEWPETVNGLYWRFVSVNREVFEKNPRMSMMTRLLDKMSSEKKERIFGLAEEFIKKVTVNN